ADKIAQIGFNRGLVRHFETDPAGRAIQDFPQHLSISPAGGGRADSLEHLFKEFRYLLTSRCLSQGSLPGSFRFSTRLPLSTERSGDSDQAGHEERRDNRDPKKQEPVALNRLAKSVEFAGRSRQDDLM